MLESGSKEFVFENKDFIYKDRYIGENPFIGQEIVLLKNRPHWGMNYYGTTSHSTTSLKEIYSFLRDAMRKIDEESPFRGPGSFTKGPFRYSNHAEGTVGRFSGSEQITHKGRKVYKLLYHGGLIDREP